MYLRNRLYDVQQLRSQRLKIPVISVGNLTTGGTGKTPVVAWLVRQLQQLDCQPGILSRGYKSLANGANDEHRVLEVLCPHVPHVQQRDRVQGAEKLISESTTNAVVLDDAFQHRRLHRDVDIVLVDALNPWGFDHLLPRGLLREPLSELRRASCVMITRSDCVPPEALAEIRQTVALHTNAPIVRTRFTPGGLRNSAGDFIAFPTSQLDLSNSRGFCGIGNPEGFRQTLHHFTGHTVPLLVFPDHHHYSVLDQQRLSNGAHDTSVWLTTLKDLVKLNLLTLGGAPLYAVDIELEFLDSAAPLQHLLRTAIHSAQLNSVSQSI